MYLRCFVGDKPTSWVDWLPWAEYCYNTSFHSTLHTTPFQVVYGREPPKSKTYDSGSSRVDAVDKALLDRDSILAGIHQRLQQAQQCMKIYYDKGHRDVQFAVGDLVWLSLLPYRRLSLTNTPYHKLSPKFYGPYKILRCIGEVAYQLELPPSSRIHDVFHVSLLKPFKGDPPVQVTLLPPVVEGRVVFTWNTDSYGYGSGTIPLYQSHPGVLAILPNGGVLADTTQCCENKGVCEQNLESAIEWGSMGLVVALAL
ncbi:hypothetical protein GH714_040311 [Hevea brasiliensis]|uniref:Tf2-1-like SH3-like domain-containing protein n=1 Tax=Hevea brasiliensis TaxID=3981 RepID=A0A6A6MUA1_HEVBR|nr:hypothetical protein GH714_040311 [Hevea brasiliensis]